MVTVTKENITHFNMYSVTPRFKDFYTVCGIYLEIKDSGQCRIAGHKREVLRSQLV